MLEYTRRTEPIEKSSRLQLAIIEWQRQLVDKARMAYDDGSRTGSREGRTPHAPEAADGRMRPAS